MQLSADAAINISSASISRRIELENRWQTGASSAFQKYQADAQNTAKSVEQTFGNAFRGMEDALVQFAMTGKLNFNSLANSIISDIIRMQARAAVAGFANFLGRAIGNVIGGTVTGGVDGTRLETGGAASNYDAPTANAYGNVFSGAPSLSAYSNTVQTSPKFFNYSTLHRFAQGGVFAEAGPEAVMPLTRMGNGKLGVQATGGAGTVVNLNVYNESGQQMEAEQTSRKNESGGFDIDLYIKKVMTKDVAVNGQFTQTLSHVYGLRRRTS
jgi:lambda family phage tail tape measure protein